MTLKLITRGLLLLIVFKLISPSKQVIDPYVTNHFKKGTVTNITINTQKPGVKIPADFLGFSYEVITLMDPAYFKNDNTNLKNLLGNLGTGIIRLGGYYVNNHYWTNRPRTAITGRDSIATSDLDSMFTFMRQIKWKAILGLNLANSSPAVNTSEAKYAWLNGRDVITAFEYGNEPESVWKVKNYDKYIADFFLNYNHIKTTLGNVPICGPASLYPEYFLAKFPKDVKDKINFITAHLYPVGDQNKPHSVYELLDERYINRAADITHLFDSLSALGHLPYRLSECNNYGDEGIGVAERFTAALWGIDFMFTAAQNNCQGVNFHGGSRGFTPIFIKNGFPTRAQALYYGMLFFHLASQGKLLPLKMDHTGIKSYAVLQPDNKISVTVINKDVALDAKTNIALNKKFTKASMILLEAPSVFSTDSITLAKASVSAAGKWKPAYKSKLIFQNGTLRVTIPKTTAALITLSN